MINEWNVEVTDVFLWLKEKAGNYHKTFFGIWGASCVIYLLLMTHQLVNSYDGLWEYSYYLASGWELTLGRWFWLYIDRLRMGISVDPLTSILTLGCFSFGIIVLFELYEMVNKKIAFLTGILFLSSTAVCVSLSYRYMSPTFGIAFLLSVLAAFCMMKIKNKYVAVLLGAGFVSFSMGAYQAYIGCTCVVLLGYLLYSTYHRTWKEIMELIIRCVFSVILGGGLYIVILNVHLTYFDKTLSNYNGADTYSFGNSVLHIFESIQRTYITFQLYFFDKVYLSNIFQDYKVYYIMFAVVFVGYMMTLPGIWKKSKINVFLNLLFLTMMPIACGAVLLIVTAAGMSIQMTAPYGLLFPVLLCVFTKVDQPWKGGQSFRMVYVATVLLLLYGNIYQVQIDQNAMLEGKTAVTSMATGIVDDLKDEECLSSDLTYCFIGLPVGNRSFAVSELYGKANTYAKFGCWWLEASCARRSWNGVFSYMCGINLSPANAGTYEIMMSEPEVKNMPVYPQKGYIKRVGNVVVIKVAEY